VVEIMAGLVPSTPAPAQSSVLPHVSGSPTLNLNPAGSFSDDQLAPVSAEKYTASKNAGPT
jgi:hypothetical protein